MKLEDKVDWLHRSSKRMLELLEHTEDESFRHLMRWECWVHLKRSLETWWHVIWRGRN